VSAAPVASAPRSLNVQSAAGDLDRTVELPAEIFDVQVNVPLMHQVVVAQLAAARQGTHSTKTRGEVRGGGKKPYRQKGTGRARQGSTRAPQFTGGGIAFGPKPRDYEQKTPKKMKAAALRGALSERARSGRVHVVAALVEGDEPSTKTAVRALARITERRHVLVVADRADELTWKSLRNAETVHLIAPGQLNTYDVLVSDDVVFTEGALAVFLAGPPKGKSARAVARSGELAGLGDAVDVLAPGPTDPAVEPAAPKTSRAKGSPAVAADETPSAEPATQAGTTTAAGAGTSDEELTEQVAEQTSSDLEAEPVFERESGGTSSDTEAAKASAEEIEGKP